MRPLGSGHEEEDGESVWIVVELIDTIAAVRIESGPLPDESGLFAEGNSVPTVVLADLWDGPN